MIPPLTKSLQRSKLGKFGEKSKYPPKFPQQRRDPTKNSKVTPFPLPPASQKKPPPPPPCLPLPSTNKRGSNQNTESTSLLTDVGVGQRPFKSQDIRTFIQPKRNGECRCTGEEESPPVTTPCEKEVSSVDDKSTITDREQSEGTDSTGNARYGRKEGATSPPVTTDKDDEVSGDIDNLIEENDPCMETSTLNLPNEKNSIGALETEENTSQNNERGLLIHQGMPKINSV